MGSATFLKTVPLHPQIQVKTSNSTIILILLIINVKNPTETDAKQKTVLWMEATSFELKMRERPCATQLKSQHLQCYKGALVHKQSGHL